MKFSEMTMTQLIEHFKKQNEWNVSDYIAWTNEIVKRLEIEKNLEIDFGVSNPVKRKYIPLCKKVIQ